MAQVESSLPVLAANPAKRVKLTGRAFYESIGSPKMILAPMVDRSEFAWRLLTRSYLDEARSEKLLSYSPMLHARLFKETAKFRDAHFQPTKESLVSKRKSDAAPFLDGREDIDRPLFVQFCANKPEDFFEAAQYVAPYCDAVDLNLGCPQGIARNGHYGAFLQEDWETISKLIRKLRDELDVPVTAKFRILETPEKTLGYARMILDAGASIITVHGRQRHQKGHNTGMADWDMIRYLRDNLPPETVLFANGNILNSSDIQPCLEATGADGVMSAEGNLSDPTIFAGPPKDETSREYWRDPHNPERGGYRIDGVFRRYLDIIHRYVLEQEPPCRLPLHLPRDVTEAETNDHVASHGLVPVEHMTSSSTTKRSHEVGELTEFATPEATESEKSSKKQKTKQNKRGRDLAAVHNPNLKSMQGHLFQLLRPMLNSHIPIRDALAKSRVGDIQAFEHVLSMVEAAVKKGLDEEHAALKGTNGIYGTHSNELQDLTVVSGNEAVKERCRRPFWVCQPHIRPLPEEAIKIGALTMSKKEKKALEQHATSEKEASTIGAVTDVSQSGKSQAAVAASITESTARQELPKQEALACG